MHSKFRIFFILLLFFTLFNLSTPKSETNRNIIISNIIVKNNQRIDKETIISYLNIDPGDKVNYEILNRKLKKMYNLGLFSDIKFRVSNNNLIVLIKENPMVNNINFLGNKKIKEDVIKEEIQLKSRNVYL